MPFLRCIIRGHAIPGIGGGRFSKKRPSSLFHFLCRCVLCSASSYWLYGRTQVYHDSSRLIERSSIVWREIGLEVRSPQIFISSRSPRNLWRTGQLKGFILFLWINVLVTTLSRASHSLHRCIPSYRSMVHYTASPCIISYKQWLFLFRSSLSCLWGHAPVSAGFHGSPTEQVFAFGPSVSLHRYTLPSTALICDLVSTCAF